MYTYQSVLKIVYKRRERELLSSLCYNRIACLRKKIFTLKILIIISTNSHATKRANTMRTTGALVTSCDILSTAFVHSVVRSFFCSSCGNRARCAGSGPLRLAPEPPRPRAPAPRPQRSTCGCFLDG